MEALIGLLVIFLILVLFAFPIWAIIKINGSRDQIDLLRDKVLGLEKELRRRSVQTAAAPTPPTATVVSFKEVVPTEPPATPPPPPIVSTAPPPVIAPPPVPMFATQETPPPPLHAAVPPLLRPQRPPARKVPAINWEQFMGVKLFMWLGGFALFLGAVFFLKYSFENGWVPPEVRVAFGFLLGIALIIGGLRMPRQRYEVALQTLCAIGIVILYAVTFSCRSIYHFSFFGPLPTFALMVLITATAFLLAVRLEARVIAILGLLGGFLTPILLSTGEDNPLGLFVYLGLLNVGLIAVALHRRWHFLVPLGTAGTIIMEVGWFNHFPTTENVFVAMIVCLSFDALFLAAFAVARRLKQASSLLSWSVAGLVGVSFLFAAYFASETPAGLQPARLFGFIFLADLCVLALALLDPRTAKLHLASGLAVFGLLTLWTTERLNPELLNWGLGIYFLFSVLHAAFPLVLQRKFPTAAPSWWGQLFPPLALLLVLGSMLSSSLVSFAVWPVILLIDVLAIVLAWISASIIAVAAVLILTLSAAAAWLFKIPTDVAEVPSLLLVIGGFAVIFFAAGLWLVRKYGKSDSMANGALPGLPGDFRAQLPAMSALLPFILLVMAIARLPITNPSSIFGLALLLTVLTLGLARLLVLEWLPLCALLGVVAVNYTWQGSHFDNATLSPVLLLGWYVAFYAIFTLFPFLFHRVFVGLRGPWITSAVCAPPFFLLVFRVVKHTWPNHVMGLLPAAFVLPSLACLIAILRLDPVDHPRRLGRLAVYGGMALFFITLIFPIQFSRQWITIGWALEGAALLWLYHRVPHRGLTIAGFGLLVISFIRLTFNLDNVLAYQPHRDTPLFNWYLYSYGLTVACLFVGAKLLAPPRERTLGFSAPPVLNALGVVLLFLLVNIEIADFFAPVGSSLQFEFSGNFGRDMTYTIAWALYAFGLLVVGIWKKAPLARYCALGLLGVALLKLFIRDLSNLGALYRIGALFAVAIIAIFASLAYQRFLPANEKKPDPQP